MLATYYCAPNTYHYYLPDDRDTFLRPLQALTCASNLEYINGSCYRRCPAGTVSRGILGCATGASRVVTPPHATAH